MKKYITDFKVVANEELSSRLFMLRLTPADGSAVAECRAGQFAELRVDGEPSVFLRRPISIHRIDREPNELWLLIQKAGRGTDKLSELRACDTLNIVYPLGNGFSAVQAPQGEDRKARVLLIGGGVGVAPLLETGHWFRSQGVEVTYLLGARSCTDLVSVAQYRAVGEVYVTTEDGTVVPGLEGSGVSALTGEAVARCQQGFATQHTILQEGAFDGIRVCGPGPMMKAVARVVSGWQQNALPRFCEVSLENKMACGLGVCLCCVEDTKEGHKCVCSEGPVFDVKELKW